jgi:hypothetical protein
MADAFRSAAASCSGVAAAYYASAEPLLCVATLKSMVTEEASGRFTVNAQYMTMVQLTMLPQWRRQLIEWMNEVSVPAAGVGGRHRCWAKHLRSAPLAVVQGCCQRSMRESDAPCRAPSPAVTAGIIRQRGALACFGGASLAATRDPERIRVTRPHPCVPSPPLPAVAPQVANEFALDADTIASAADFLDRLLSVVVVPPAQLQTAALACCFLAAKLHEPAPITMQQVRDYFSEIASAEDVRRAELNILYHLGWDVNSVTALAFMRGVLALIADAGVARDLREHAEAMHALALTGGWAGWCEAS